MLTIVYALAMGLSIGATATVARRIGEKDPDGAARAAVQAIALGVSLSLASASLALFAPGLLGRWARRRRSSRPAAGTRGSCSAATPRSC